MQIPANPDVAAFNKAHQTVSALVEKFQAGSEKYLSPSYQESEARTDFLDPFWIALGWDVRHETQINPYQQEVKIEKGVSMSEGRKRADYAFYLAPDFNRVRFYVEAKKPSRALRNPDDCFQAVRYGWNSNVPLVVLSDFEEILLMDCRAKPDLASAPARILESWHFTDWLDKEKFSRFYFLFSREAVAANSIEGKVAELLETKSATGKQGKLFRAAPAPVDLEFLKQLEEWRARLAVDFHAARPELSAAALTETTQRALDRLVFLRFLEDKAIETTERVSKWHGADAWRHFVAASRELDKSYNGVLWKKHDVLDDLNFKPFGGVQSAWSDIAFEISASQSPYLFNLIPIPILGSIYERFLGNEIEIDALRKVAVAQKPEARKAGGVYYTPDYIVQYIVAQTVGKIIENKTPEEMASLRFADIACGSGSFLLGVYDLLLRRHAEYFAGSPKAAKKAGCLLRDGAWILSLNQRRAILENNIFGGDIDAQAVEVAKLSLYLKLLEDETAASARQFQLDFDEQILPDLESNIVCGNALVGFDVLAGSTPLAPEEERKLNPMDWQTTFPKIFRNGGFDAIVGNPPYRMLQPNNTPDYLLKYLREHFVAAEFKIEFFHLFLERASSLLNENGYLGYIVPATLLNNVYAEKLRRHLTNSMALQNISVAKGKVFADADVHTFVLTAKKESQQEIENQIINTTFNLDSQFIEAKREYSKLEQKHLSRLKGCVWNIQLNQENIRLILSLLETKKPLSEIAKINRGLITGDRDIYFSQDKTSDKHFPILTGSDVERYFVKPPSEYVLFERPKTAGGCWDKEVHFASHKIVIRQIGENPTASLITEPFAVTGNVFTIRGENLISEKLILACLNSSLIRYFWKIMFGDFKTSFPQVTIFSLSQIPIPDLTKVKNDEVKASKIVSLVDGIISARAELQSAQTESEKRYSERKVLSLDRQLDESVYALYELSPAEIELIETAG